MAEIAKTSMTGSGSRAIAVTTLGASDTITFTAGKKQTLYLNNVTAGALTPSITGDDSSLTAVSVKGIGSIDLSAGYIFASIGAGDTVAIPLDSISEYLKGTLTVTGGDGIEASFFEY